MNIFERASRENFTFSYKGTINVSDLWNLKPANLSTINEALGASLSEESKYSLTATPNKADEVIKAKMAVVTHIHTVLVTEAKAKVQAKAVADEVKKLESLLDKKNEEALGALTPEEIQARIAALKA